MKRTAAFSTVLLLMAAACDPAGPSGFVDFPFFYLQDVDCPGAPVACTFLDDAGDVIAVAGSHLFFLDYAMGYVKADVDIGYPLSCCAASSEGGYAMAASGQLLFRVSDGTYLEHDPVLLPAQAEFILTKPAGTVAYVVCSDGSVATVSTVTWTVTGHGSTAVSSPSAAAITADGSRIFIGDDADDTVKMIDPATLGLLAAEDVPGGAADICPSPSSGVWLAPAEVYQAWHIDQGTGLHDASTGLPGLPVSLCPTPDGKYIFAGCTGQGLVVVDMNGQVQAGTESYGVPSDIAVSGDGQRSAICAPELLKILVFTR